MWRLEHRGTQHQAAGVQWNWALAWRKVMNFDLVKKQSNCARSATLIDGNAVSQKRPPKGGLSEVVHMEDC
jgi:hypothetical protein